MNVFLLVETPLPPISRANLRLYYLGRSLVQRGHRVHLISPSFHPNKRKSMIYDGMYIHQYPGFANLLYSKARLFVRTLHIVVALVYTLYLHFRIRADVIQGWNPLAGLVAILAGRIGGVKTYLDFTDFYSDIAKTDSPLMYTFFKMIERYILTATSKVIVVSNVMKELLAQSQGIQREKIVVISDGVDAQRFNPEIAGTEIRKKYGLGNDPVLIYHGDIKYHDGVDLLLAAFERVLKKMDNAKLLIVGGGGKYFEQLKRCAESSGFGSSVIFTGWVEHRLVPEFISAADVAVMPSRPTLNHNCYVSFKLFEYWGVGKPVVVTKLKAISEIAKDNVDAVFVEPEDRDNFAEALLKVLSDPDHARTLGRNGRELVEKKYDWNILMAEEAKLYV